MHDILANEKGSDLPLIRWEFCGAKDFLPIPFMGVPYISVGKQVFQCHQGNPFISYFEAYTIVARNNSTTYILFTVVKSIRPELHMKAPVSKVLF